MSEHPAIHPEHPQETPAIRRRNTALLALLGVCVFWGATFPLMKDGMDAIERHLQDDAIHAVPVIFLLMRFAIAALFMPLILRAEGPWPKFSLRAWHFAWWLAVIFVGSFYLQVYGLRDVDASVSAFATSLYVVFTPLIVWLWFRRAPAPKVLLATGLALLGVGIIAYNPAHGLEGLAANQGLILSALCGVGFAVHIVATDYTTTRVNPTLLSTLMMLISSVLAALTLVAIVPTQAWLPRIPEMMIDFDLLLPLSITTLFATVFAVWAWNRWQKDLGPSRAAVLYTMEPVFSTIISISMGKEDIRWLLGVGAGIIIATNLWLQLGKPAKR